MESVKRKVRVVIEKEIEIELTPAVFGKLTKEEYLAEFCRSLWEVENINDVAKYAAEAAATGGSGYQHDGLGLLGEHYSEYPRVPDVKFREISSEIESEIL